MKGAIFQPATGDSLLVLEGGGVLVCRPGWQPFIFRPDGTREELKEEGDEVTVRLNRYVMLRSG